MIPWRIEETIEEVRNYCRANHVAEVMWKIDSEAFNRGFTSLYLKIGSGSYQLGEVSLNSPKAMATMRPAQETKALDEARTVIDEAKKKQDEEMNTIEVPLDAG